jgi:hypothetical protein
MNVYISHSTAETELAGRIAASLRSRGHRVWYDGQDVSTAGAHWAKQAARALDRADVVVVLISPESAKSPAVRGVIQYALSQPRLENRFINVLVRRTKDFPWILEFVRFHDLSREAAHSPSRAAARIVEEVLTAPEAIGA